jgi:hypothetical protein
MSPDMTEFCREAAATTAKGHRRRAFRIELFIVGFILAAVAFVCLTDVGEGRKRKNRPFATIATYNHISACKSSLRGYYGHDDDVHRTGVATGATSFGGWTSWGHYSDGSAYVWGKFLYSYGKVALYKGRCTGGDYAADWFAAS